MIVDESDCMLNIFWTVVISVTSDTDVSYDAVPLLAGERGLTDFCDSSPRGDCAFVPTGISPGPHRFSGWNLENEGLPRGSAAFF